MHFGYICFYLPDVMVLVEDLFVVLQLQTDFMLKIAWILLRGFFMEVKVDCHSDIEGSSCFLSSIVNFYVLVSLLVGSFYCKL